MANHAQDDLDTGHVLANALVLHVEDIGADYFSLNVNVKNKSYTIVVTETTEES